MKTNCIQIPLIKKNSYLEFDFNHFPLCLNKINLLKGENGVGKSTLLSSLDLYQSQELENLSFCAQEELESFVDLNLGELKKTFCKIFPYFNENKFNKMIGQSLNLPLDEQTWDKTISSFSGGEKQLIKICLFLALQTKVYILDEPFNHLALGKISFLKETILEMIKSDSTFIIVDHGNHFGPLENSETFVTQLVRSPAQKIEIQIQPGEV